MYVGRGTRKCDRQFDYRKGILYSISHMTQNSSHHKYSVKSLEKALSILELMTVNGRDLGLTEIARTLDLGKGTVHRIISTLKARHFVQQDPDTKKYGFGIRVFDMGSALRKDDFLRKATKPELFGLSLKCREAVSVAVLEQDEIRYIARLESDEVLRVSISVGTRFPAHCTSTGKVLLSDLPDEELSKMYGSSKRPKKLTSNSIDTYKRLKEELEKVREVGLAYDYEEAATGVYCLAAPIKNSKNQTIAAVSISGPKERMAPEKISEYSQLIAVSTKRISKTLGFKDVSDL